MRIVAKAVNSSGSNPVTGRLFGESQNRGRGKLMVWQIQQISDVGTSNPIVARMAIGIMKIIDFSTLDKNRKENLKANCFEIMNLLTLAEKTAKPIVEEIAKIKEQINAKGIQTQSFGRCIDVPAALRIEDARVFIKYAKQGLHEIAENINIIYDKKFDGPHFHKIQDYFISEFGENFIISKLLNEDQAWIKQIIDLRNEDEHPKTGKSFVNNFNVQPKAPGGFTIFLPTFFNGIQIASALEVFSHNLLTFAEEITVFSLTEKFFPAIATVYEIPAAERNQDSPIRFRVGLKEAVK